VRCSTVVDSTVDGDIFEAFVEHVLVPTLRPGDVEVMDNLSDHKRARTRELIELSGAELAFLPPYSPGLNPIEMVFSQIKQLLRGLACRSRDTCGRPCSRCSTASRPATQPTASNSNTVDTRDAKVEDALATC